MATSTYRIGLVLLWAAPLFADGRASTVTTRDGRVYSGRVRHGDRVQVVETPEKDVWLTEAAVESVREDVAEPEPVYRLNEARVRGPKAGTIQPTLDRAQVGPLSDDGLRRVLFSDPGRGPVEFTLAVTELHPRQFVHEAVEYEYRKAHPLAALQGREIALVRALTPPDDPAANLKAALFFRIAGRFDAAREFLDRADRLTPGDPRTAAERGALLRAEWGAALAAAAPLADAGDADAAERALQGVPGALPSDLAPRGEAIRTGIARIRAARARLRAAFPARADAIAALDAGPLERMDRALAAAAAGGLRDAHWDALRQPWAESLAAVPAWTAGDLDRAQALAARVAAFFAAGTPADTPGVARELAGSPLPFPVRWEILRRAALPAPGPPARWERVDFDNPFGDGQFHYFIRTPPNYRPDVPAPAVLALHGQAPMAGSMLGIWGPVADRLGWILISPEYIYGRRAGYRGAYDELESVLGALHHAAGGYAIDLDRVHLTGFSQGGHAAWDMGAAHAGRFASVVPFIGHAPPARQFSSFRDTALYAVGGEKDFHSPGIVRPAMSGIGATGAAATYVEYRGRGHELYFEEYGELTRWMARQRRQRDGRITLFSLAPPENRREWLEILEPVRGWPPSRRHLDDGLLLEGRIEGNDVHLESANVRRARVFFSPDLLDLRREVRVFANGRRVFAGRVEPDWAFALEDAHQRRDRLAAYAGFADVRLR